MQYSEQLLAYFFQPKNVGEFPSTEKNIGRSKVGNPENGALIYFQIKVERNKIVAAKFKAYGNCPIIATCSYTTEWVKDKTLLQAAMLTSTHLVEVLAIPDLKIHCALLVEDALKLAIKDYVENQST
jgi:NifU-like protein involved in Fe-S cluster formation